MNGLHNTNWYLDCYNNMGVSMRNYVQAYTLNLYSWITCTYYTYDWININCNVFNLQFNCDCGGGLQNYCFCRACDVLEGGYETQVNNYVETRYRIYQYDTYTAAHPNGDNRYLGPYLYCNNDAANEDNYHLRFE